MKLNYSPHWICAMALMAIAPAYSAVVTSSAGELTHTGAGSSADAFAAGTWLRTNVRDGSTVGITSTFSRDGNGSFSFSGSSGTSKADIEYYGNLGTLGGFTGASYDWYRDSSSTVADHLMISFRIAYDNDGDLTTTGDQGVLVFENVYNAGGAVTEDSWVTATIDLNTILWQNSFGNGINEIYNRSVADWLTYTQTAGEISAGQDKVNANTTIIGLSLGIGSGWSGTFAGAVDDINFSSSSPGATSLSVNFESIPEPSALLLGALGAVGMIRRKR